jgi:DNA-binding NarL/FixJ family response regulator
MIKLLVIVDDDPAIHMLIEALLAEEKKFQIVEKTKSAREALKAVRKTPPPHIAILDHYLEGSPLGLDAAASLKAAAPGMKILLFSSHDLKVEADLDKSIDGFLSKNDAGDLLMKVREILAEFEEDITP